VYGVFEPVSGRTADAGPFFEERFEPGSFEMFGDRIETAWWLLEKYAGELDGKAYVIERYPNGGMIVEMTPL
jgi:pyruvate formate-lyase activating enzyme-like uncharacterized protein